MGSLFPLAGEQPKFAQIYFYEPHIQRQRRHQIFEDLSPNLVRSIQNLLHQINPYVHQFRCASELLLKDPRMDLQIVIFQDPNADRRPYNAPTASKWLPLYLELIMNALIMEICLYKQKTRTSHPDRDDLQIISDLHSAYDSLHYVLMFPYGNHGWAPQLYRKIRNQTANVNALVSTQDQPPGQDLSLDEVNESLIEDQMSESNEILNSGPQTGHTHVQYRDEYDDEEIGGDIVASSQSNFVSCREFYSNRLMRFDESYLHKFGRLYQQFIVDSYLKVEHKGLRFIELNQDKLRVEMYKGLVDAYTTADQDLTNTGRMLILPSSFVGGPRYMINLFNDAMAIVRDFGKPDLFVTVTCNPDWPEIQAELGPNQSATDIPDIVSRIFRLKLKAILEMILKNGILGKTAAHVYVIEYQKRVIFLY